MTGGKQATWASVTAFRAQFNLWGNKIGTPRLGLLAGGAFAMLYIAALVWSVILSHFTGAPWLSWSVVGAAILTAVGLITALSLWRFAPNPNRRGQYAPRLWRLWIALALAIVVAGVFEWVVFGLLSGSFDAWPWEQLRLLHGGDELVQPAIALLTPFIALVTAVFAHRKAKISLAESQRADVAAFQQRYIDAARLLSDSSATARIAGAIAMGSLSRDWVDNRQECVDVICGYLRVRPSPEQMSEFTHSGRVGYQWHLGEDSVRHALASELVRLFSQQEYVTGDQPIIHLDLAGAFLAKTTNFTGTAFTGDVVFTQAVFTGETRFDRAAFGRFVSFVGTTFAGEANFEAASFANQAYFVGAQFNARASFERITTSDGIWFSGATFSNHADFSNASLNEFAQFADANFKSSARFERSTFAGQAIFDRVMFLAEVSFRQTLFALSASFNEGRFLADRLDSNESRQGRAPLGPLDPLSVVPEHPGILLDDSKKVIGEVEWYKASE